MPTGADVDAAKRELRGRVIAARRGLDDDRLAAARAAVRRHVLDRFDATWTDVLAYAPLRTEPGSPELLADLTARDARVHLPVLLPDRDLDWARWPEGAPTGLDTPRHASILFVPAFAVDHAGRRLGRGGGSYDRALTRVADGVPIVALLHDGELLDAVPVDRWDRPVTAAVTPQGWFDLR